MPADPADLLPRLAEIAGRMNSLKKAKDAAVVYDALADAVWWSDERPASLSARDQWCLRPIFRYRMSLILGTPEEEHRPCWEEGRRQFPGWPGFARNRLTGNDELRAFYERAKAEALRAPPPASER